MIIILLKLNIMRQSLLLSLFALMYLSSCKVPEVKHLEWESEIIMDESNLIHNFTNASGEKTFKVESKIGWQNEVPSKYSSWLSLRPYEKDKAISVLVTENRYFRPRTGTFRIFNAKDEKIGTVNQEGMSNEYKPLRGSDEFPVAYSGLFDDYSSSGAPSNKLSAIIDGDFLTSFSETVADANSGRKFVFSVDMSQIAANKPKCIYVSPGYDMSEGGISRLVVSYNGKAPILDTVIKDPSNRQVAIPITEVGLKLSKIEITAYPIEVNGVYKLSLADVAFKGEIMKSKYFFPYKDESCTDLQDGITDKIYDNLNGIPFVYNMVYHTINGNYSDRMFTLDAKPYTPQGELYDLNITVADREPAILFAGNIKGNNVWMCVEGTNAENRNIFYCYSIVDGANKILLPYTGKIYIRYDQEDPTKTYEPITINFASGIVAK